MERVPPSMEWFPYRVVNEMRRLDLPDAILGAPLLAVYETIASIPANIAKQRRLLAVPNPSPRDVQVLNLGLDKGSLWSIMGVLCRSLYTQADARRSRYSPDDVKTRDALVRSLCTVFDVLLTDVYDVGTLAQWQQRRVLCIPICEGDREGMHHAMRFQRFHMFVMNGVEPTIAGELIRNLHALQPRAMANAAASAAKVGKHVTGMIAAYRAARGGDGSCWYSTYWKYWNVAQQKLVVSSEFN